MTVMHVMTATDGNEGGAEGDYEETDGDNDGKNYSCDSGPSDRGKGTAARRTLSYTMTITLPGLLSQHFISLSML